ncbi:hypothetical protein F4778DRAFT_223815 [Xylariomycetidae sp. FL2044]|nr:hypothetical protein F4778DRAFT_223815 [Xylariomycetidae sp. FL2044]
MASSYAQATKKTHTLSEIHHALLRPAILQILRAQGYYSSTPATIDALTELAGHYLTIISQKSALHASLNNEVAHVPSLTDVRMALEDCGALWPNRDFVEEEVRGEEDTRGVDDFIKWATGRKNLRIRKLAVPFDAPAAVAAGENTTEEPRKTDYLDALKKKHNKTDQDSKYAGTLLGKPIDRGEVMVEGGQETSISAWEARMHQEFTRPPEPEREDDLESRPPSSGLSSLTDGALEDMEGLDFS